MSRRQGAGNDQHETRTMSEADGVHEGEGMGAMAGHGDERWQQEEGEKKMAVTVFREKADMLD